MRWTNRPSVNTVKLQVFAGDHAARQSEGNAYQFQFPSNFERAAMCTHTTVPYNLKEDSMSGFNNAEFKNARPQRKLATSKVKLIRKVKHLIRFIQDDGWYLDRTKGSHRHFKHPTKPGIVTVPKQFNADLRLGTLSSALKQAGLKN